MSLSTCERCGGHIPLGPTATNRCEKCGAGVFNFRHSPCNWTLDEDIDAWNTTCGEAYCFIEDGPVENTYRFCPGCGQPIAVLRVPMNGPDLSKCPKCGGPADNGHDRELPPNPYWCLKCITYNPPVMYTYDVLNERC